MELQSWGALYNEIALKLTTKIPDINWLDLWHNQVGFLVEEHPFPTPAVFLAFRLLNPEDLSEKTQKADVQVDIYYFYETFLDTYQGAFNKTDALDYLKTVTEIHKVLHGSNGDNYAEMRRVAFAPVDTGSAGNLYRQSFVCNIVDATAAVNYNEASPGDINYTEGATPEVAPEQNYQIP